MDNSDKLDVFMCVQKYVHQIYDTQAATSVQVVQMCDVELGACVSAQLTLCRCLWC